MKMLIEKNAAAAAYVTSGTTVILGLTATDFAALVGATVSVLTFIVHLYFKVKADRRAEAQCRADREE